MTYWDRVARQSRIKGARGRPVERKFNKADMIKKLIT
jgi:hypothetical protein